VSADLESVPTKEPLPSTQPRAVTRRSGARRRCMKCLGRLAGRVAGLSEPDSELEVSVASATGQASMFSRKAFKSTERLRACASPPARGAGHVHRDEQRGGSAGILAGLSLRHAGSEDQDPVGCGRAPGFDGSHPRRGPATVDRTINQSLASLEEPANVTKSKMRLYRDHGAAAQSPPAKDASMTRVCNRCPDGIPGL
jgi:hypothetical protein